MQLPQLSCHPRHMWADIDTRSRRLRALLRASSYAEHNVQHSSRTSRACVLSLQKSFVSHSSLVSSPAPDRPGSGSLSFFSPDAFKHYGRGADARADAGQEGGDAVAPNKYVCFNAKLFAQRMRRAPLVTQQKVRGTQARRRSGCFW